MATTTNETGERLPTTGPEPTLYDQYQSITTGTDDVIVYDTECEAAWIQSNETRDLETWR